MQRILNNTCFPCIILKVGILLRFFSKNHLLMPSSVNLGGISGSLGFSVFVKLYFENNVHRKHGFCVSIFMFFCSFGWWREEFKYLFWSDVSKVSYVSTPFLLLFLLEDYFYYPCENKRINFCIYYFYFMVFLYSLIFSMYCLLLSIWFVVNLLGFEIEA